MFLSPPSPHPLLLLLLFGLFVMLGIESRALFMVIEFYQLSYIFNLVISLE